MKEINLFVIFVLDWLERDLGLWGSSWVWEKSWVCPKFDVSPGSKYALL